MPSPDFPGSPEEAAIIRTLIGLLRPHQWTKNVFCFAGAIFGGQLWEPHALLLDLYIFLVFCAASSAVYIFNDIIDRQRDRWHPQKRHRPVASGAVRIHVAALLGAILLAGAVGGAWVLGPSSLICVGLYVANNLLYSLVLKNVALVDVLSIAAGFVLRLMAGVYVLADIPTAWIVVCTFFLASFLGFAKRRGEIGGLETESAPQRPVLSAYTISYLDLLVNNAATMAIMSYALFTVTGGRNPTLALTVPIVYYAIMQYKWLVTGGQAGEQPAQTLLTQPRILVSILLWLAAYVAIDYGSLRLLR